MDFDLFYWYNIQITVGIVFREAKVSPDWCLCIRLRVVASGSQMFADSVGETAVGAIATLPHIGGTHLSAHVRVLPTQQDVHSHR